ncbi:MAG: hypothetical protein M3458_08785 [Acidobacteriota bacterium]|nr:hypothetical protein [Acidobacteriota bacterium]
MAQYNIDAGVLRATPRTYEVLPDARKKATIHPVVAPLNFSRRKHLAQKFLGMK